MEEEQPIVPVDNFDDLELCVLEKSGKAPDTPNEACAITVVNNKGRKFAFNFRPYGHFIKKYDLKVGDRINLYVSSVRNKAFLVIKDSTGVIYMKKYCGNGLCFQNTDFCDRLSSFYQINFNDLKNYKLDLIRVTNEKGEPVFRNGGLLFEIDLVKIKQDGQVQA